MDNVPQPEVPSLDVASGAPEARVPERLGYRLKCRLLGPPLTNDQLRGERLGKGVALGVLAPDCISSSAYGTEQILTALLPYAALGAFTLLLPITGVILAILVLLTLCYRQVVMVYTRAGGSYVVARENFGPKVAQVAAVALLIDYVVTVAVQAAAGTVAVASALPALGPYSLEITIGVVLLLAYGNLRGIKEAGRAFAVPTYFFTVAMGAVIVVGLVKAALGTLPQIDPTQVAGTIEVSRGHGFVMGATVLVLLRAFANGGSSLTGLEAISNGVSAFKEPAGPNARRALVTMACILGFLVGGVSLLAYLTHATPHTAGYPSVISQEAELVFGDGVLGHVLYIIVQAATALVLYTGANTSFNGFPFLASFVAEDQFLPRQLRRRGHRLVFSNAIVVLTVIAVFLLVVTRAQVDALVPFYAIGVFTGFTMAGLGMARYFQVRREHGWRRHVAVNLAAGITSALVVLIFAVAKFTEGAWAVVILFPALVFLLIRLNREYRAEAAVLRDLDLARLPDPAGYAHHTVLVLVDALDLATLEALRYGRGLRPTELRAVHLVLDDARSQRLLQRWESSSIEVPLELVECPDRRLGHACLELARAAAGADTQVTVLLPRRTYAPLLDRLLHDHTADHIARIVSQLPHAAATIVPFDTNALLHRHQTGELPPRRRRATTPPTPAAPPHGASQVQAARPGQLCSLEGTVHTVQVGSTNGVPLFACEVIDPSGSVTAVFPGQHHIPEITPGTHLRLRGRVSERDGKAVLSDPTYEVLEPGRENGDEPSHGT